MAMAMTYEEEGSTQSAIQEKMPYLHKLQKQTDTQTTAHLKEMFSVKLKGKW